MLEADWFDIDPEDRLDRCNPGTLLPGRAVISMVSATLSRQPDGFFDHDLLVQHASAHGTGPKRRLEFDVDRLFQHVGRSTHFDLLIAPEVYGAIEGWLRQPSQSR